jgi:glycosyltransferase involved in cell wall biosynthesis
MSAQVTIILPVYNGAAHLRGALNALLQQTFANFEILIIDDGSTDDSVEIIRAVKDKRLRLIQQQNRGLSNALNRGILEASTPFIARNDQDDLSQSDRIAKQLFFLTTHTEYACLFSFYRKFGSRRQWANADKQYVIGDEITRRFEPRRDGCQLGSTMFCRREVLIELGGFRQLYYPADDWDLELRLTERYRVGIWQQSLVSYRFHTKANTYRLFYEMQQKSLWAEDSAFRRQKGFPELRLDEFLKSHRSALTDRFAAYARWKLRLAGQHYLDGRNLRASLALSVALIADLQTLLGRARTYLRHRCACRLKRFP